MAHLSGAPTVHPGSQAAGTGEVIRQPPPPKSGESALAKHLLAGAAWTWEGHKPQAQPSLRLCGVPKNLNMSGLELGSACNPGSTLDSSQQSNWSLSSVDWESTHTVNGGKPSGAQTLNLPTQASDVCSVPASLQHD